VIRLRRGHQQGIDVNDTAATTDYSFDAFQRLTEVKAQDATPTTIVDFVRAYDYNGNPLYTQYAHNTARSELYGTQTGASPEGPADALNRLTRFRRGTLDANKGHLTPVLLEGDRDGSQSPSGPDKLDKLDAVGIDAVLLRSPHRCPPFDDVARPIRRRVGGQ
jgi:hypothetical protein